MTFGIPVEYLPISNEGNAILLPQHSKKWIARRYLENQTPVPDRFPAMAKSALGVPLTTSSVMEADPSRKMSSDCMQDPKLNSSLNRNTTTADLFKTNRPSQFIASDNITSNDVLTGRGKHFDLHQGNIQFRSWIDERRARYDQSNRSAKTAICKEIVKIVDDHEGRFLQPKDGKKMPNKISPTGWNSMSIPRGKKLPIVFEAFDVIAKECSVD